MPKIIAFAGRKRSGKTTLAKLLQEEDNAVIITIADYLKHLCCQLMGITYEDLLIKKDNNYTFDVVPDERWFKIIDKKTKIGVENIKKELDGIHITNIRQLLQVIGTDVIRKYDKDWHVNQMIEDIESYGDDKLIVIDDVRFPNEREAILKHGGEVFFIIRPNMSDVSNHVSETSLKWQDFKFREIILNDNITLENFKQQFKVHYKNDFECFIPGSIFLIENNGYIPCSNFGEKYDDFVSDIVRQLKNDRLFKEYGLIRYHTHSYKYAERYINEVDDNINFIDKLYNEFITHNPLIVENLKIYLI